MPSHVGICTMKTFAVIYGIGLPLMFLGGLIAVWTVELSYRLYLRIRRKIT